MSIIKVLMSLSNVKKKIFHLLFLYTYNNYIKAVNLFFRLFLSACNEFVKVLFGVFVLRDIVTTAVPLL